MNDPPADPFGERVRGIRRWREDVRLYEEQEMRSLLAGRGLRVETIHGEFDGRPFSAGSPRMLIAARS